MSRDDFKASPLSLVENREISAVTFVRDYVQLHFDGPYLNAYVWPIVIGPDAVLEKNDAGFRDALCDRIGVTVTAVDVIPTEKISLVFSDKVTLEISLRCKDLVKGEAIMLQDGTGRFWEVW